MSTPKVAFIVVCRNKAPYVAECVRSVLAQTYSPMEIILSDQGSEDGSYEVMAAEAAKYTGPNTVRLVRCPDTQHKGTAGYVAHLNWLHHQTDADLVIQTSADDVAHPMRAERTVSCWLATGAQYIATKQQHVKDGEAIPHQWDEFAESCWVPLTTLVESRFCGKCSSAWTRALWERNGPLPPLACQDLIVPFWAAKEKVNGVYFIAEPLHNYIVRADADNMGLEGRHRMEPTQEGKWRVEELMHYLMCENISLMTNDLCDIITGKRPHENETHKDLIGLTLDHLVRSGFKQMQAWSAIRTRLSVAQVDPMALPS